MLSLQIIFSGHHTVYRNVHACVILFRHMLYIMCIHYMNFLKCKICKTKTRCSYHYHGTLVHDIFRGSRQAGGVPLCKSVHLCKRLWYKLHYEKFKVVGLAIMSSCIFREQRWIWMNLTDALTWPACSASCLQVSSSMLPSSLNNKESSGAEVERKHT